MKRAFTILIIAALAVFAAVSVFAGNFLICKWCGEQGFANLHVLVTGYCSYSPTHRHEPFEGAPRKLYYCKFCAAESTSFKQLVISPCSKSPTRHHQAYAGAEHGPYTCKWCGAQSQSFKQLVLTPCRKSPRGYHDAL